MNKEQQITLQLLRSALWQQPADLCLVDERTDWQKIINIARQQAVTGLVANAILALENEDIPRQQIPSEDVLSQCVTLQFQTIRANQQLDKVLVKATDILRKEAINLVVLKGQGIARCYNQPSLRTGGDIDLYVGEEECPKAVELLRPYYDEGTDKDTNDKHYNLKMDGVEIELHRRAIDRHNTAKNRWLQQWAEEELTHARNNTISINGTDVSIPSSHFNVLFLFYHLWYHFCHGGIGLRQLCDWARCLHVHHAETDTKEIGHWLKQAGLQRDWQVFGHILTDFLGLPKEEFPLYTHKYHYTTSRLIKLIFAYGNFGFIDLQSFLQNKPQGWWSRRWYTFSYKSRLLLNKFIVLPKTTLPEIRHFYWNGFSRLTQR